MLAVWIAIAVAVVSPFATIAADRKLAKRQKSEQTAEEAALKVSDLDAAVKKLDAKYDNLAERLDDVKDDIREVKSDIRELRSSQQGTALSVAEILGLLRARNGYGKTGEGV